MQVWGGGDMRCRCGWVGVGVCVCARACVRVRACGCVRVGAWCVRVCVRESVCVCGCGWVPFVICPHQVAPAPIRLPLPPSIRLPPAPCPLPGRPSQAGGD